MDHSEEAVGQLVVACCDGAVDLEVAEHALDAVALLVERTVMLQLQKRFDLPGITALIFRSAMSARIG